jgi:hypothetical protein
MSPPVNGGAGGTMTVTFAGDSTPTPKDWLTLVPFDGADSSWVAWMCTSGRAADSLTFPLPSTLPAGAYDLRLFVNDSFVQLALSNVIPDGAGTDARPGPSGDRDWRDAHGDVAGHRRAVGQ